MRKPSPATVIATVALFVALGGAGIAANGQSLILGKSDNGATLKTGLSAPVNDKALQLTNTSAGASATALGLTVAPGHAPFTVNSQTRVANLNADRLDGVDSGGFVRGKGASTISGKVVTTPIETDYPRVPFFTVPGFGTLDGQCPAFAPWVYVYFTHAQGGDWVAADNHHRSEAPSIFNGGPAGSAHLVVDGEQGGGHVTLLIVHAGGTAATVEIYTNYGANSCDFYAQAAIVQGG